MERAGIVSVHRFPFLPMSATLFTIGYEKRSIEEYVALLIDAGVTIVVDVRETAWSHKPGFSKTRFRDTLAAVGITYLHAPWAGNPKTLRDRASSHEECISNYRRFLAHNPMVVREFDRFLARLASFGHAVALTCFERHPDDCHRSVLAEVWGQLPGRAVEHLAPSGCARLISA
jgi:uncharacterized protein (DUF488 family)